MRLPTYPLRGLRCWLWGLAMDVIHPFVGDIDSTGYRLWVWCGSRGMSVEYEGYEYDAESDDGEDPW